MTQQHRGPQRIDRTGQVYGSWTVLRPADPYRRSRCTYWTCRCACGTIADVQIKQAIAGRSRQCSSCKRLNKHNSVIIRWGERTMIQADWARALGLLNATLGYRVTQGWPLVRALTEGVDPTILTLLVPDRSEDPVRVFRRTEAG